MQRLLTIVCAVVGAWLFVGGIASFVTPSDAVPSSGTNVVFGGVLLLVARVVWRRGRRTNHSLSFVLLPQAGLPSAEEFQRAWNELTNGAVPPRVDAWGPETIHLQLEGGMVSVGLLPTPIPGREAERAASQSACAFAVGGYVLAPHTAHLVVFSGWSSPNVVACRLHHTRVVAALAKAAGAVAVYEGAAGATHDAAFYLEVVRSDGLPVELWTGVRLSVTGASLEFLTLGLEALQLPELLVSAPANQCEDALSFLFVVVGYLAHRGEAIAAGETVGRSAAEKCLVAYVPSPLDPTKQVMRVDMARKA